MENGQSESLPPTKLAELDRVLDQFEHGLGLPARVQKLPEEVVALFNVTKAQLRGMSAEDCGEAAALLMSFAFHLQRATNVEKTKLDFCEEETRRLRFYNRGSPEEYEKLLNGKIMAKNRLNRLNYLANKLEAYSWKFSNLESTKRKQHG